MVGALFAFHGWIAARPGPALVPQATLKPAETREPDERAEHAEQRKQRNPSTRAHRQKITQIYEGTNQICRMVAGRQVLAEGKNKR